MIANGTFPNSYLLVSAFTPVTSKHHLHMKILTIQIHVNKEGNIHNITYIEIIFCFSKCKYHYVRSSMLHNIKKVPRDIQSVESGKSHV